jgi:FKBP-type peptidyl-prolyl cis-trans isomerase 2
MLRVLLLLLLLGTGCISDGGPDDTDYSDLVLASGDFVKLEYTGIIEETGEIFDTTKADVAYNSDVEKADIFKLAERYEPLSLTLGKGEVLPALEVGIAGMKIGETRKVIINTEEGYGEWVPEKSKTLPRTTVLPKLTVVAVSEFAEAIGREPELNETLPLNYWNVTIVDIQGENMTLSHEPVNNTNISTEYGTGQVTLNDTHVVTRLSPNKGDVSITSYGIGIITDVNETHFIIDYNHPLAGKDVVFEVTIKDILKAGSTGAKSITWTDYETGIETAKSEKKQAIIYFSIKGCKACEAMDVLTFPNPELTALNDRFVWINVDIASQPEIGEEYEVEVYPTIVMMEKDGEVLEGIVGYSSPYDLAELINLLFFEEKA